MLYAESAMVILPEISSGLFWESAIAANGNPQLSTGPQKWVDMKYVRISLEAKFEKKVDMMRFKVLQKQFKIDV